MSKQSIVRRFSLVVALLLSIGSPFCLWAASEKHYLNDQNPVIAKIGKKEIRLQSLEDKKINDVRKYLYEAIMLKLKIKVLNTLSEKYAKYKIQINPLVTKEEISDFYDERNLASQGTLKDLAGNIKNFLTNEKVRQIRKVIDHLYQDAMRNGLVTQYIRIPNDFLITIPIETGFFRNKGSGPVMLLEYSDYQCPYCQVVQTTIARLRAKYGKKVSFVYRHFPLAFHTEADEAANATECSREQGKFEAFHQYFFANQSELPKKEAKLADYLKNLGKKLGIENQKKFESCIDSQKYRDLVQNDINSGTKVGISGTPAFLIGKYDRESKTLEGEIKTGGLPFEEFDRLIQKYM